jgi:Domain of unknown function (DUF4145)
MSLTAKIEIEPRPGTTMIVICGECGRKTDHEVLTKVSSSDDFPDAGIWISDEFLTIQCRGCKTVSFCKEGTSSEDVDPDDGQITTRTLFPGRIEGRPPLNDIYHLPFELQKIYQESRSALMEGLSVLTGIGIRAIVETVCREKKSPGRVLEDKIGGLVTLKLITQTEAEILHDLRFMGNKAAHEVKAHSTQELNLAFDVVEHLLKAVYILPEQAKRLPSASRRSLAKKSI